MWFCRYEMVTKAVSSKTNYRTRGAEFDRVLLAEGRRFFLGRSDCVAAACGGLRAVNTGGMRRRAVLCALAVKTGVPDARYGRLIPSPGSAPGARAPSMRAISSTRSLRSSPSEPTRRTGSGTSHAKELIDLAERMGIPTKDAVRRVLEHLGGRGACGFAATKSE